MKTETFYTMVEKLYKKRIEIMRTKGKEYTIGSDDKLANFKSVGVSCDTDPLKVWLVYASKHWASICNYVKDGVEASDEKIDGRFMDLLNYLELGLAIIKERQEDAKKT